MGEAERGNQQKDKLLRERKKPVDEKMRKNTGREILKSNGNVEAGGGHQA